MQVYDFIYCENVGYLLVFSTVKAEKWKTWLDCHILYVVVFASAVTLL